MRFDKNGAPRKSDMKKVMKEVKKLSDRGPLIRVELEFKNGEINKLVGKEATKWHEAVCGQSLLHQIHGFGFPQLGWKVLSKKKKEVNIREILTECLGALAWLEESGDIVADVSREDFCERCVHPLMEKILNAL